MQRKAFVAKCVAVCGKGKAESTDKVCAAAGGARGGGRRGGGRLPTTAGPTLHFANRCSTHLSAAGCLVGARSGAGRPGGPGETPAPGAGSSPSAEARHLRARVSSRVLLLPVTVINGRVGELPALNWPGSK